MRITESRCLGPISIQSGCFSLGYFSPISRVSHFEPSGAGLFGQISKVGKQKHPNIQILTAILNKNALKFNERDHLHTM